MKISERYLRSLITAILLESDQGPTRGDDLTPPEPDFTDKDVPESSISVLKQLQSELGVAATGKYDYDTEKAWDELVMSLPHEDVVGVEPIDIATSWANAAPLIQKVRGSNVGYTQGMRGMLNFVRDLKSGVPPAAPTPDASSHDEPAPQQSSPDVSTRSTALVKDASTGRYLRWPKEVLNRFQAGGINFNKLIRGDNNYRASMHPMYTKLSVDFFRDLKQTYGIERVVTLNAEEQGSTIPNLVEAAGLESVYVPIGTNPDPGEWARIKSALDKGNTLVHCRWGADRTGAVVARWYVENQGMTIEDAIDDLLNYKKQPYKCYLHFVVSGKKRDPRVSGGCDRTKVNSAEAREYVRTHPGRNPR